MNVTTDPRRARASAGLVARTLVALTLACAGLALLAGAPARADGTADEADLHFQLGNDAYRRGDYLRALEHFLASNRLAPNRNVVFNIARAYQRLDRFPEAYRYYADAHAQEPDPARRAPIEAAMAEIASRVALVEVQTSPAGATLFVDREDLGSVGTSPRVLALPPGEYRFLARLDGHHGAASEPQAVAAGQRLVVRLELRRIVGTLLVRGEEGAAIRIDTEDGDPLCVSPCDLPVAPGPHVLHATAQGREPLTRAFAVGEGQQTRVDLALVAQTGSIVVSADVTGAMVQIDGVTAGFTPLVVPNVPTGARRVRVVASGYEPVTLDVEVEADRQAELTDVRLRTLREVSAASREIERIEDAPASVSVITGAELEAFRFPTIYEALRGQRGFALSSDGIYPGAAVRGIGQPGDYNNRLLILSDGATLNENILYQGFIGYDGRVDLGDVSRIEVVRGAGSVLYGTGAMSGVVNLVPIAHDVPTSGRFELSLVDGDVMRARSGFHLRLADDAGVRGAVAIGRSDGRDVPMRFDADGDGVADDNVARRVEAFEAVTGTARAWVGPLTVQGLYTLRRQSIPMGSFGTIFDRPDNVYEDHRGMLEARFEPRLSDDVELRTRAYVNFYEFHLDYFYDAEDEVTGAPFEQRFREAYQGVWTGGEARVVAHVVPQLRISGGVEGSYHPVVSLDADQTESDGSLSRVLGLRRPYGVLAGYALADWEPVRELRVSLGGRVDGWLLPAPAESFVSFNPRLAVVMRLTPEDTLKVLAGRAFRAPSIYEQFYEDGGTTQLPSTCCGGALRPETLYTSELEYTHRFDDDWSVLVSGHFQYAEDFIDFVSVPPANDPDDLGLRYFTNVGASQVAGGGDVEVRRELRGGWMFTGQVGALYATFLDAPAVEGATDNLRVPNTPYLFGSARAIVPILERLLRGAVRLTVEAPRRISLTTDEETGWAVVADVVASGTVHELGLTYAVGLYNLFDWRYPLPASQLPVSTFLQRGRSLIVSLGLELQ
ncbi:MAG: TonB-dependent receptor [Sandaracinaceae bacterium]|nr:TonB-dependent receptor [Sandaracinaceae bacterium]